MLLGKALAHGVGAGGGEDFGQGRLQNVAEGDVPFGIEAAGDDGAVDEDADMIAQGAAAAVRAAIGSRGVRPGEFHILTKKDLRCQFDPLARRQRRGQRGREGKEAFESPEDRLIAFVSVLVRQVPETQTEKEGRRSLRFFDKIENHVEIGIPFAVFKAVQREVDLPQRRAGEESRPVWGDQGGIGGEIDLQPLLVTERQELREIGVEEWLAEEMEGEVIGPAVDPL